MTETPIKRFWGRAEPRDFPRFANEVTGTVDAAATEATFRIYGPIDSWGGYWGVSAVEVAEALDELPAGVETIRLHINSPGGEIFEGIAIKNLLAEHPARVVAHVDSLAASIASVIAVGADELVMGLDSHLMIHDGSTYAGGTADDLRSVAEVLDTLSDTIAGVYARKTGGTAAEWRAVMRGEKWYGADAAVEAGLADRTAGADETTDDEAAVARFDLAGVRAQAAPPDPAPAQPAAEAPKPEAPETPGLPAFQDQPAAHVSHEAYRIALDLA